MELGSVLRPKTTKNIAANRSRRGSSTRLALCAVDPEIAIPRRNAPTAADTCIAELMPATNSAAPSSLSRSVSLSGLSRRAETYRPYRRATTRTTVMTNNEIPTASSPPHEAHAREHRGQNRQVQRHRQVFEHQNRQHDRCLAVTEAPQVAEHLGDDSRRRDVGDAGHDRRPPRRPSRASSRQPRQGWR